MRFPLAAAVLLLGCGATPSGPHASTPTKAPSDPGPGLAPHPFGVLLGGRAIEGKIRAARALGTRYYRTTNAVFIDSWNGRDAECDAARTAGLDLVLTVRAGSGPPLRPSRPPEDLDTYRRTLGEILDKYRPALLVVENEENSAALFYDGTPEEYHAELRAACEVAHARGIRVANGGLVEDDYSLRPNGAAYRRFLDENFPGR